MADISICSNEDCPLREICYRALAKPSKYAQSYTKYAWSVNRCGNIECEYFAEVGK